MSTRPSYALGELTKDQSNTRKDEVMKENLDVKTVILIFVNVLILIFNGILYVGKHTSLSDQSKIFIILFYVVSIVSAILIMVFFIISKVQKNKYKVREYFNARTVPLFNLFNVFSVLITCTAIFVTVLSDTVLTSDDRSSVIIINLVGIAMNGYFSFSTLRDLGIFFTKDSEAKTIASTDQRAAAAVATTAAAAPKKVHHPLPATINVCVPNPADDE